jgi:cytochrome c biogenesis protein CcmG, thiol:disulfide interchange protein DsbE
LNRKVLLAGLVVVLPLLGILVVNLGRDPHAIRSPLVGKPAPAFELPQVGGGGPVSLADLRGKPVVVNFWATWCIPCLEEHNTLQEGARRLGPGVQFVGIVYEDEEALALRYLRQRGSAYPSLMDEGGRAAIAYGVAGVPETYFIDATGTVVSKYAGPLDPDRLALFVRKAGGAS